ncbi:MAG: hypothetical protein ACR5K2_04190 [Wolbachia sp.]
MRKIDRKLSNTIEQDKFRVVRKSHEDNINAKDNRSFILLCIMLLEMAI